MVTAIKLPIISEHNFAPRNCFRYYAFQEYIKDDSREENENKTASYNFFKGLRLLHEEYLARNLLRPSASVQNPSIQNEKFQKALGYFHLALAAKPDYFCAREALQFVAERLGHSDVAEREEYALQMSNNPHPELPCHLLHAGFFSASDLEDLAEELK